MPFVSPSHRPLFVLCNDSRPIESLVASGTIAVVAAILGVLVREENTSVSRIGDVDCGDVGIADLGRWVERVSLARGIKEAICLTVQEG